MKSLTAFPELKTTRYCKLAHILLVDDNPEDAHLIEIALTRSIVAHQITVAAGDADDALRVLQELALSPETYPDLILLALNSPDVRGLEILAEIKRAERHRSVPVIALTSSIARSVMERAYALHANCCVHKRNTHEELFAAIDSVCRFWLQTAALPRTPWWT